MALGRGGSGARGSGSFITDIARRQAFEKDAKRFELDIPCPRCKHTVRAIPLTEAVFHVTPLDVVAHLLVRCPRGDCHSVLYVEYDRDDKAVREVLPHSSTRAADFHLAISEPVREDWAEAHRCFYADAKKGVVVMCRRIVQVISIDKNATGKDLFAQINDLFSQGHITASLKAAAHEVRHFGNFGAHPQNDGLDDISNDDAVAIMAVVRDLLQDLYVRPHEVAKLTLKRQPPSSSP